MAMTSNRSYLARALYEWILDNECTPYILVNAMADNVKVPQQYVKNGQIVLNVSPAAVVDFLLTNDGMSFNGRFGGVPMSVMAPIAAIMGVYAKESGQGMFFDAEDIPPPTEPKKDSEKKVSAPTKAKPSLKVIK